MNKWMIRTILLAGYCIPFAFLSMYGDAAYHTMLLYVLMIAGFGTLCFGVIKSKQFMISVLGNLASLVSSYICLNQFSTDKWEWYFKPFTADTFLMVISTAAFLIQVGFVWRGYKKQRIK